MKEAVAAFGLILSAAAPARASSVTDSAIDFGAQLYRHLPDHLGEDPPYTPELASLVKRARNAALGPKPDLQPLCDCFAVQSQHYHLTNLRAQAGHGVTLFVTIYNDGLQQLRLDLARRDASWQIADIHGAQTPSLVQRLKRYLASPVPPAPPQVIAPIKD